MLGGRDQVIPGWVNVDLHIGKNVHIKADVSRLDMFQDAEAESIYASHILEHFSHQKTVDVLKEWCRVLKPGGTAYISVPDFDAMMVLANEVGFSPFIRNMFYGDQEYPLAYHYTIFTYPTLAACCIDAGFSDVKRLVKMPCGLMDCSTNIDSLHHRPISVSVEATK